MEWSFRDRQNDLHAAGEGRPKSTFLSTIDPKSTRAKIAAEMAEQYADFWIESRNGMGLSEFDSDLASMHALALRTKMLLRQTGRAGVSKKIAELDLLTFELLKAIQSKWRLIRSSTILNMQKDEITSGKVVSDPIRLAHIREMSEAYEATRLELFGPFGNEFEDDMEVGDLGHCLRAIDDFVESVLAEACAYTESLPK